MTKEELAEISMMIVTHAGTAKSMIQEAINLSNEDKFDEADKLLSDADVEIIEANKYHFKALEADNNGGLKIDVLFLHAEDQFLSTQMFKTTAEGIIQLHKKISNK